MNHDREKNVLLLLPPFYTPFTPPLGISILKAYLERHGYAVTCFDFNTVPHLWVMHHKYFELLRKLEGITTYHGYTNLWYVLQAHMLAHLNGLDAQACAKLLMTVLPIYGIKPESSVVKSLTLTVAKFFSELEEELLKRFDPSRYSTVGTSTYSTSLAASLAIHRKIKQTAPHIKTVMGGGVFADDLAIGSDNLDTLLKEYPEVDHVIVGEGEILFHQLLEGALSDRRLLKLSDLDRSTLDMKDVPVPDYSDFDHEDYLHLCIEGARSCPFQCSFCSETIQWGDYRKKPLGTLARQMIELAEHYQNNTFYMGDSLMNPYIEDLCGSLLKADAHLVYDGYLRADKIATHRDRARRWARSGLVRARLGIESASRRVLANMVKMTTPEGISEVLKSLASAGIRTTTLWIVGFPEETEEDFQETLDFISEHHRYIYELDVHYYYYYPYGQVGSRLYQCYPLYPEEVGQAIKFQQWEIVDANPSREVKFDRLVRMNDLAVKLGIPNLHTLEQRYRAEERWQQLFPLARDVFDGIRLKRPPVQLTVPSLPVFSEHWKRPHQSPATEESELLSYQVAIGKQLDETLLAEALAQLSAYHETLQQALEDGRYVKRPAPEEAAGSNPLYVLQHSTQDGEELSALKRGMLKRLASQVHPSPSSSVRVGLLLGEEENSDLLFVAHRALFDSRSVILLLEDLFRIYEQLAEGREVSLQPIKVHYSNFISQLPASEEASAPAAATGRADATRNLNSLRRAIGRELDVVSLNSYRAPRQQSCSSRVISAGKPLTSRLLSGTPGPSGLTWSEIVSGALLIALARVAPEESLEIDMLCDYRIADADLRYTTGSLTGIYPVPVSVEKEGHLAQNAQRLRDSLRKLVIDNRRRESLKQTATLIPPGGISVLCSTLNSCRMLHGSAATSGSRRVSSSTRTSAAALILLS